MADHAHAPASDGAHGGGHGGHFAHTTPLSLLIGILAALLVLTVLTVSVTSIDLGAQGNLTVAMIIATIKAGLVVTYFMHLRWDSKLFGRMFWAGALLAVAVYVGALATFEYFAKA